MRVLPHQQDTGGFFVTVLTKKSLCDWESKLKSDSTAAAKNDTPSVRNDWEPPSKKSRRHQGYKEDPYIYFDANEPIFKELESYYGLNVSTA